MKCGARFEKTAQGQSRSEAARPAPDQSRIPKVPAESPKKAVPKPPPAIPMTFRASFATFTPGQRNEVATAASFRPPAGNLGRHPKARKAPAIGARSEPNPLALRSTGMEPTAMGRWRTGPCPWERALMIECWTRASLLKVTPIQALAMQVNPRAVYRMEGRRLTEARMVSGLLRLAAWGRSLEERHPKLPAKAAWV